MSSPSIAERVLQESRKLPEGSLIRAKSVLHLGSRAGVDQALSRLAREGALLRIARGTYCLPVQGAFGPRSPEPSRVVEALAQAKNATIVESGAAAAHALGLTTQVPVRATYWTSGPEAELRLGRQRVLLRTQPKWKLVLPQKPAGMAIRALASLPRAEVPRALKVIECKLSEEDFGELLGARAILPGWLAEEVSQLARRKSHPKPRSGGAA